MLPYRRESPALPRCPVRGGRVVHGPQFAYCPSPQGRCPQPSSSSSSPSPCRVQPCRVQLCFWPDPGPGSARLSCTGGPLQGCGHNAGAPSSQLCTGCRVPTPAPSPSVRCLALTMASPAPAPPGAWARAGSGTSWIRCPGRGPGWAWMSCRSQVRPPGGGYTGWGAPQRPARGTQRGLGVPGDPQLCPWDWQQFLPTVPWGQSSCWHPSWTPSTVGCLPAGQTLSSLGFHGQRRGATGAVSTGRSRVGGDGGDTGSGGTAGDRSPVPPGAQEDGIGLWEPWELGPCCGRCLTLSLVLRRAGVLGQSPVHLCLPSQGAPDVRVPVPLRVLPGRAQLCLPAGRR